MIEKLYTTHDVSKLAQVDPSTVSKWIDRKLLIAFRTPGGHRRIRRSDLLNFLTSNGMPVPAELGGDGSVPSDKQCLHVVIRRNLDSGDLGECESCHATLRIKVSVPRETPATAA